MKWTGGPMPVAGDVLVMVKHRNGVEVDRQPASAFDWSKRSESSGRTDAGWDIMEWDEWVSAQPALSGEGNNND